MPKADIAGNGYDLSINRYKEIVYDEIEYVAARQDSRRTLGARRGDPERASTDLRAML